ncbi:MAG: FHA domain-containing protein [Bacteroidetes bacterium]|nr:FHA domain-containing protein [Fibrella sp.]
MMVQSLQLICGNPNCKVRLLIKDPHKSTEAKCPVCGYINPLPGPPVVPVMAKPLLPGEEHPTVLQKHALPTEVGWLLVGDEQTTPSTLVLRLGLNTIGRQSVMAPSDLMLITADEAMSRQHCTIEVRINRVGSLEYILQDGAQRAEGWKNSLNGTFVDGSQTRLGEYDRIYLNEGNVIQLGQTKLTLKTLQLTDALRRSYSQAAPADMQQTVIETRPMR